MIVNVRKAFQENVAGLAWMDRTTIDAVQDKVWKYLQYINIFYKIKEIEMAFLYNDIIYIAYRNIRFAKAFLNQNFEVNFLILNC